MKRIVLLSFVIISVFLLSSCQLICEFVIVNKSNNPIEIMYELENPNYRNSEPYYTTLKEFNDNEYKWRKSSDNKQEIITGKGVVKLTLGTKEVLRLQSVDDVRIKEKPYEELNVKILTIKGKNGLLRFEGNQIFNQFEPEYKSWSLIRTPTYIFRYE